MSVRSDLFPQLAHLLPPLSLVCHHAPLHFFCCPHQLIDLGLQLRQLFIFGILDPFESLLQQLVLSPQHFVFGFQLHLSLKGRGGWVCLTPRRFANLGLACQVQLVGTNEPVGPLTRCFRVVGGGERGSDRHKSLQPRLRRRIGEKVGVGVIVESGRRGIFGMIGEGGGFGVAVERMGGGGAEGGAVGAGPVRPSQLHIINELTTQLITRHCPVLERSMETWV